MFATQIRRLRHTTDLLQTLVNNECVRLAGDSPVEAIAADAENDGSPGFGDEEGRRRQPASLRCSSRVCRSWLTSRRQVRFIPHFYLLTRFNLDPLVDGLSLRNLGNSPARNRCLVATRSSTNPSVSRIPLYAFPFPGGRHRLTPSS